MFICGAIVKRIIRLIVPISEYNTSYNSQTIILYSTHNFEPLNTFGCDDDIKT